MRTMIFALLVALSPSVFAQEGYQLDVAKYIRIPEVESPELREVLRNATYYKLPQVWQHYVPPTTTTHVNDVFGTKTQTHSKRIHQVYSTSYAPDSHANFNFPWETTIGLNSVFKEAKDKGTKNPYSVIDFIYLSKPVLVINTRPVFWIFAPGTVVGEIIYVTHDNVTYVQEIRFRKKDEDSRYWSVGVVRPVVSKEELAREIGQIIPDAKRYMFFRNPQEDEVQRLEGTVEVLPNLSEATVKRLLAKPFKDVPTNHWSPCSEQEFSILPKHYCFGLLNIDQISCAECHRQTSISVRNLVPKDPDVINTPQKIGNIRGCDGVFTWHPFDTSTVPSSEEEVKTKTVRIRKSDQILLHTPGSEPPQGYVLTEYVQQSLKSYELPPAEFLHKRNEQ